MGEVTKAELDQLRREVSETRVLVEALMLRGVDRDKWDQDAIQAWLDGELARRRESAAFGRDGVWGRGLYNEASSALMKAGLLTLQDVACKPRAEVAAIPGIGRASLARLDEALSERDLTWAGAP